MKKTKIVCTLGPATDDPIILEKMIYAGMDVARLNFSHSTHAEHKKRIDSFKAVRKKTGLPIALMLDTKGPEIRIKTFKAGAVDIEEGQLFTFTAKDIEGTKDKVSVTYAGLCKDCLLYTSPSSADIPLFLLMYFFPPPVQFDFSIDK